MRDEVMGQKTAASRVALSGVQGGGG